MDFIQRKQPAWPFLQRIYIEPVKPKPQPKAAYRDNFSQPVLPTTWQTPWADSLFGKRLLN